MSKAKMMYAKELIQAKEYDKARAVLRTVDHPAAREWEAKLDRIAPMRARRRWWRLALGVAGVLLVLGVVGYLLVLKPSSERLSARINLSIYCLDWTDDSAACDQWVDQTFATREQEVMDCFYLSSELDSFSGCMLFRGIKPETGPTFAQLTATQVEEFNSTLSAGAAQTAAALRERDALPPTWTPTPAETCDAQSWGLQIIDFLSQTDLSNQQQAREAYNQALALPYPACASLARTYFVEVLHETLLSWESLERSDFDESNTHLEAASRNTDLLQAEMLRLLNEQSALPSSPIGGSSSGASCPGSGYTCSQLTCAQAYACLAAGNTSLDRDGDGIPCESQC